MVFFNLMLFFSRFTLFLFSGVNFVMRSGMKKRSNSKQNYFNEFIKYIIPMDEFECKRIEYRQLKTVCIQSERTAERKRMKST